MVTTFTQHLCSTIEWSARRLFLTGVISTVLLAVSTLAYAEVLYVDGRLPGRCPSLSYDVASRACGGRDGQGFSNLAAAIAAMRPGDTVAIREGTYDTPLLVTKSGTADAPLRIVAHAGEPVVFDLAGAPSYATGIEVGSQRYIEFSGLTVVNAPVYGFRATGATDITITNSEFANSRHGGVVFEGGARIVVTKSRIHGNNNGGTWHEGVTFSGVTRFEITDSEIYDNDKEGIDAKYGATGGVIARNHTYRNNGPNIYIDAASDIQIYGNVCHTTLSRDKACIGLSIESTFNPNRFQLRNVAIFNNVMYGSATGVWFWIENGGLSWAQFEGVRIEYNTIVDNSLRNWGGIYFLNGTARNFGFGNTIRNNILMGNGGTGIRDSFGISQLFTIDHNLFQNGEASATLGSNAVVTVASPFVNRAAHDYHLVSGSPARNVGQPIPDITTDLEGRPRPTTAATDVGAYQFVPQPPPPLTETDPEER